ncbi:WbuC family cupin fold metalloprotein [Vibrio breoganii]
MNHIGESEFDELFSLAKKSNRLRSHLNLHTSHEDKVQRLLIAMIKGSFVKPHYHALSHQWELFTVLKGVVRINFHSNDGEILSTTYLGEGQKTMMIMIDHHEVHSVECISEKALLLEVKEGPFSG